jgi:hypothetical protein
VHVRHVLTTSWQGQIGIQATIAFQSVIPFGARKLSVCPSIFRFGSCQPLFNPEGNTKCHSLFGAAAFQPKALTGVARIQGIAVQQIDDLTARSASYTTDKIWQNCTEIIEHLMIQDVFLGYPIEYHHHDDDDDHHHHHRHHHRHRHPRHHRLNASTLPILDTLQRQQTTSPPTCHGRQG